MIKHSTIKKIQHNSGFSMIELMVAMVIGLILMGGVMELYVSNKMAYKTSEAMSRLQENARYALYQLQKDVRMAGYADCAPNIINHLNPAGDGYSDSLFNLDEAVGGWEFDTTGPGDSYTISDLSPYAIALSSWDDNDSADLPASLQNLVVPGTDIITLKSVGTADSISVATNNNINSSSILTNGANGILDNTILLVTQDCYNADLFQKRNNASASSVSKGNGSSTNPGPGNIMPGFPGGQKWSNQYGPGAKFLTFQSTVYYIGMDVAGIPSLYRASFNIGAIGTPEKLVDGVENMQLLYGEDTDAPVDGVANIYRTINTVVDPENISTIRISLLMRTIEAVAAESDTKSDYKLAGHSTASATEVDPINDRFLRYVFTSTIKLRNRGSL
jgi:type IV pilus assembly protein PilW